MNQAVHGKELIVRAPNRPGLLKQVSKLVGEKGINVQAFGGWTFEDVAVFHLTTTDNDRAREALRGAHFDVNEGDVVLVELPNKPGMLKHTAERLDHAGIDLKHMYASASEGAASCLLVFSSSHNGKAITALNL